MHTNLAASIHVEQTHTTSQLLGVLDAMPQNAGGEIEGALIGLNTQGEIHKHINLPALEQTCRYFYLYIRSRETNSASEPSTSVSKNKSFDLSSSKENTEGLFFFLIPHSL